MDSWLVGLLAALAGALVVFFGMRGRKSVDDGDSAPPRNTAVDVIRETIQKTLNRGVSGIEGDLDGDDPAGRLADRGNNRDRK